MRYNPSLDGLRAFAVLAVLATHAQLPFTAGGWTGVEVFFVLSGYLITRLLITEHAKSNTINLPKFYVRRLLRLYPVLLVAVLMGAVFYRILSYDKTLAGYGVTASFAGLYLQDLAPLFSTNLLTHSGFATTWSLAVEEQFYLIWPPILVWLLSRRRDPLPWAAGICALSFVSMTASIPIDVYGDIPQWSYYLPWNRIGVLLAGCCLALAAQRRPIPSILIRRSTGWFLGGLAIAVALTADKLRLYPHMWWEDLIITATAASLIWHLAENRTTGIARVLRAQPVAWLGRRSYGIYLFHYPVLLLLERYAHQRRVVDSALMLMITISLAALSYRYVESPFLRLKSRFQPLAAPRGAEWAGSGQYDGDQSLGDDHPPFDQSSSVS